MLLYFQSFTRRFDRAEYAPRIAINQINAGDRRIPSYNRVYCFQNFKTVVKGKQLMEFLDITLNTLIVFNAMDNEFDRHINMIMRSVYLFLYLIFFFICLVHDLFHRVQIPNIALLDCYLRGVGFFCQWFGVRQVIDT